MRQSRFTESQIVAVLREGEAGIPVSAIIRKHGISRNTYFNWKARYSGAEISDLKRLRELEVENARLKKMYSDLALENTAIKELLSRKTVTPSAKREAVAILVGELGLSISRACRIVRLSRAAHYRAPRPALERDRDVITALRGIVEKALSAGFWECFDRLRLEKRPWNYKRVRRVYRALELHLPRRAKWRVPTRLRRPTVAPTGLNQIWALDFMSDAVYGGMKFRTLNVIDEGNREVLAVEMATSIPSVRVVRLLDELVQLSDRPVALRMDNGPELTAYALQEWCEEHAIDPRHIQPGKPDQNAFVKRFNRSYREDVVDAYVFESADEVRSVTEEWIEDYNGGGPHDSLGGAGARTIMPRPETT